MEAISSVVTEASLHAIVQAIREVREPAAILLFGSQADGTATADSDIDLLVIRTSEFTASESRYSEVGDLYRAVGAACHIPKDILLMTMTEFEYWRYTTNHVAAQAARNGRVLFGSI